MAETAPRTFRSFYASNVRDNGISRGKMKRLAVESAQISFSPPMLATLVAEPFSDDEWIFESKLDGVRCLAIRDRAGVQLLPRSQLELTGTYAELAAPLERQLVQSHIADGEVVAFKDGVTSFSELQQRN